MSDVFVPMRQIQTRTPFPWESLIHGNTDSATGIWQLVLRTEAEIVSYTRSSETWQEATFRRALVRELGPRRQGRLSLGPRKPGGRRPCHRPPRTGQHAAPRGRKLFPGRCRGEATLKWGGGRLEVVRTEGLVRFDWGGCSEVFRGGGLREGGGLGWHRRGGEVVELEGGCRGGRLRGGGGWQRGGLQRYYRS